MTELEGETAVSEMREIYGKIDAAFANGEVERVDQFEIVTVKTIDSTNTYLLEAARKGAPGGRVVVTRHKSAGRGRRNRKWDDKAGESLLFSTLYVSTLDSGIDFGHLMGVAIVEACREFGVSARLKWPNDVLVDGCKLAGILGESIVAGNPDSNNEIAIVIGCGINVNHHFARSESSGSSGTAGSVQTSLRDHVGMRIDTAELLRVTLTKCASLLRNPNAVADAYRELCSTIGQSVRVERDADELFGTAIDVDSSGALIIDTQGEQIRLTLGDVVHLRTVE